MSVTTPITQRDVAHACGVHPSTICLALKNSPSIPLETRQRIQAVADALGYQPNVAARNLALLRTEKKPGGSLPIAWINQEARRDHWRTDPAARPYFEGARQQAEQLGFHLEEIWTQEPAMTVGRVIQIVRARGIDGVVFPAHRHFDTTWLTPAWSEFALVGFNDLRLSDWTDVFAPDYHHHTALVLQQLQALGAHRRIGLVLSHAYDAVTHGLVHGSYLRQQAAWRATERVPVLLTADDEEERRAALWQWVREERPDLILSRDQEDESWLRTLGWEGEWLSLDSHGTAGTAVIDVNAAQIASAAIDCVVAKMRRFEKGLSASGRLHLLRGQCRVAHRLTVPAALGVA